MAWPGCVYTWNIHIYIYIYIYIYIRGNDWEMIVYVSVVFDIRGKREHDDTAAEVSRERSSRESL